MRVERIDTADPAWIEDARLADYRIVRDPALVRASNAFLAEGRLVVRALLMQWPERARSVLATEAALRWLEQEAPAVHPDLPAYVLPPDAMQAVGGVRFHQGCLAAGTRPPPLSMEALLDDADPLPSRVLGMDGVTNPDNVGAMFRTAAGFGVGAVVLSPACASPLYRKALRTSMGAALRVPFVHGPEWAASLAVLRARGYVIWALTPDAEAAAIETARADVAAGTRLALLVGAEGDGLGKDSLAAADRCVRIPMVADMDSLNVAAATAVALYGLRDAVV